MDSPLTVVLKINMLKHSSLHGNLFSPTERNMPQQLKVLGSLKWEDTDNFKYSCLFKIHSSLANICYAVQVIKVLLSFRHMCSMFHIFLLVCLA